VSAFHYAELKSKKHTTEGSDLVLASSHAGLELHPS